MDPVEKDRLKKTIVNRIWAIHPHPSKKLIEDAVDRAFERYASETPIPIEKLAPGSRFAFSLDSQEVMIFERLRGAQAVYHRLGPARHEMHKSTKVFRVEPD
jgi:hypothetical protein